MQSFMNSSKVLDEDKYQLKLMLIKNGKVFTVFSYIKLFVYFDVTTTQKIQ